MSAPCNILVSSAGRRVVLIRLFQQALRELGLPGKVYATDLSSTAAGFHAAAQGFFAPLFSSGDFIPEMLKLCKAQNIRLVIPTIDTELGLYAEHKQAFADIGTTIAISTPETIDIGGDKIRAHEWLAANDFPIPRQATLEEVLEQPGDWPMPLIAKPRAGSSSIGVTRIHDPSDLQFAEHHGEMIVQTLATGKEYTIDVFIDRQGKARCSVPRLRVETRSGEVSKGLTVRHDKVQRLAERVCEALPGGYGVFNVQIFVDNKTGDMRIIEFNPRFGGGYPLAHEAGAHYIHWLIEDTMGLPSSIVADQWRDGLMMMRYDEAIFVDRAKTDL
ncbi:ATP-grasp domain-containing protein [Phycisphaeraceae bacterium D3-23]